MRILIRLVLAIATTGALLAGATHAAADEAKVTSPPPAGVPKDFSLPDKIQFRLDNGMAVTMVPFGAVPKVSMALRVRTGNLNEGEDTWLADIAGRMMTEGAGDLDSAGLARRAAELGGSIGVSTGPESTTVSMGSIVEKETEALALLADVARRPWFPDSELERIRQDFLRNLSIAKVRPQAQASVAFNARIYGDHPFSVVFPEAEQLMGYTIEDVRRYYEGNFGARRSHLFVSGRFDAEAMRSAVKAQFGDWQAGPEVYIDVPDPIREGSLTVIDRPGAPQSTIVVGIPVIGVDDPDYTQLLMANSVLGGAGFLSRLFQNLREDKGWTYGPSTGTSNNYRSAVWQFSADVATEATGPSLREFFAELERLKREPPSEEELQRIRGYRGGIFVLQNASRTGVIGTLAFMDFHDLPDTYLTEYLARLAATTPEKVSAISRAQWPIEGMTMVVVGDRSVIDEQLAEVEQLNGLLSD
jgi:predicted Zn-dependent peptidase